MNIPIIKKIMPVRPDTDGQNDGIEANMLRVLASDLRSCRSVGCAVAAAFSEALYFRRANMSATKGTASKTEPTKPNIAEISE